MTKEYNGEEKRSQVNSALRILIDVQNQTHSCVKKLQDDVTRNSALTAVNGVKIDNNGKKIDGVVEYEIKCDKRLKKIEYWKAGHTGEKLGRDERFSKFNVRTTLICVAGTALIALLSLWFTQIQPALNASADVVKEINSIKDQLSEHNILK